MAAYIIGYDLNKTGKDYEGVFEAIKAASVSGNTWWHYLDSTWIIKSSLTTSQVYDRIKPHIDNDDSVLIIEIKNNKSGRLPQKAWDYLNNVIFA